MKKLAGLLLAFVCILTFPKLGAAQVDSCWYFRPSDSTYVNRDSVLIDTCTGSPTFGKFFCQKWFGVTFDNYLISLPYAANDSILEVSWHAVDSSYDSTRKVLEMLESKFGTYYLRKRYPEDTLSNVASSKVYRIRFENYVEADSVMQILWMLPKATFRFESEPSHLAYVPNRRDKSLEYILLLNPVGKTLTIKSMNSSTVTAYLYSIEGRLLRKNVLPFANGNEQIIDVSSLSIGSYYLSIGSDLLKFIKQ